MPAASVIVPARDAAASISRALECIARQRLPGGHEVIVVDDGSVDSTVELARAAGARVLEQDAQGPAAARNLGAAEARAEVLAFCDADVFVSPGWLRAGVEALADADVVQGQVLPDSEAPLGPFDRTIWVTQSAGLWETANLFVTRAMFDRVGGFEEWLKPRIGKALAEDVWFGWRCVRAGARMRFCGEALAHHAVFPRSWAQYAEERRRLRYFPAMARQMPELRERFLHRRLFLSPRTARFDAAVLGVAGAVRCRSPWPLALSVPYLRAAARHAGRARPRPPRRAAVAAADLAADVVGLYSLVWGSIRYRSPVL